MALTTRMLPQYGIMALAKQVQFDEYASQWIVVADTQYLR